MRVRTVYFKTDRLAEAADWWRRLLGRDPVKQLDVWHEFRVGEVNLGFLRFDAHGASAPSRCVPVIELPDDEIAAAIARAKNLGARAILEGEQHPDHPKAAAVLVDPFGNEFELTCLHG